MLQPVLEKYPVDILTSHYRVYGEIQPRGDPHMFFNSENVDSLIINDATMMPLREGMRLGAVAADELYVPISEPQVIIVGNYQPQVKPLPKRERLICFTDTYILRGFFHMSVETRLQDVFWAGHGPYFPATMVDIYALYPMAMEVKANAALCYLNGPAVRAFYAQEETGELNRITQ